MLAVKSVKLTGEWVTITTLANIRQQLSEHELPLEATHFPCIEHFLLLDLLHRVHVHMHAFVYIACIMYICMCSIA